MIRSATISDSELIAKAIWSIWQQFKIRQLPSREAQVTVTFLAYTNNATGTRLATFVVSNLSSPLR